MSSTLVIEVTSTDMHDFDFNNIHAKQNISKETVLNKLVTIIVIQNIIPLIAIKTKYSI